MHNPIAIITLTNYFNRRKASTIILDSIVWAVNIKL